MSNKLNPFEEQLRQAANSHEVPYDASQWDRLESQLGQKSFFQKSSVKFGLSAVAVLVIGLGMYYLTNSETPPSADLVEQIREEVIPSNENEAVSPSVEPEENNTTVQNEVIEEVQTDLVEKKTKKVIAQKPEQIEAQKEEPRIEEVIETDQTIVKNELTNNQEKSKVEEHIAVPNIILAKNEICSGVELTASLDTDDHEEVIWYLGNGETIEGKNLNLSLIHI